MLIIVCVMNIGLKLMLVLCRLNSYVRLLSVDMKCYCVFCVCIVWWMLVSLFVCVVLVCGVMCLNIVLLGSFGCLG